MSLRFTSRVCEESNSLSMADFFLTREAHRIFLMPVPIPLSVSLGCRPNILEMAQSTRRVASRRAAETEFRLGQTRNVQTERKKLQGRK